MPTDEELMQIARKKAKDKTAFYFHFACYVVVNIMLLVWWTILNKAPDPAGLFAIMSGSLIGWGIGIIAHFVSVFAGPSEQRVQKEFKKLKGQ